MIRKIRINEDENKKPSVTIKYDEISSTMDAFKSVRDALRKQGISTKAIASAILKAKPSFIDDAFDIMEKYVDIEYI